MANGPALEKTLRRLIIWMAWLIVSAPTGNAQSGTWSTVTDMPTARLGHAVCATGGKIYAIGGYAAANQPGLTSVEVYDPQTGIWAEKAPMPTGRRWLACSAVDGRIYAIGGFRTKGTPALDVVEVYDSASNSWRTASEMLTPRKGLATAVIDGMIYAVGGVDANEQMLASAEVYDPSTDMWTPIEPMPTRRGMLSVSTARGKLYAMGGPWPGTPGINTVEEYDPVTDTWTRTSSMPTARWALATASVGGRIYAIGGAGRQRTVAAVEEFDPESDRWVARRSMPDVKYMGDGARFGLAVGVVDGKIFAVGGSTLGTPPHPGLGRVQRFTPPEVATGIEKSSGELKDPASIRLHPNYPNPFHDATILRFDLPVSGPVRIVIYDMLGRAVRVAAQGARLRGRQMIVVEAGDLPGGTYLYRVETPAGAAAALMQLVR